MDSGPSGSIIKQKKCKDCLFTLEGRIPGKEGG